MGNIYIYIYIYCFCSSSRCGPLHAYEKSKHKPSHTQGCSSTVQASTSLATHRGAAAQCTQRDWTKRLSLQPPPLRGEGCGGGTSHSDPITTQPAGTTARQQSDTPSPEPSKNLHLVAAKSSTSGIRRKDQHLEVAPPRLHELTNRD